VKSSKIGAAVNCNIFCLLVVNIILS